MSGFELAMAATLREGKTLAMDLKPKVIIVDCFLPKREKPDGRSTRAFIRWATETLRTRVIAISGWKDIREKMLAAEALAFIEKPFKLRERFLPEIFAQLADRRRYDDVEVADAAGV